MEIPGYTIIRELGSGGMASVYLANQDRLHRQVALKVMRRITAADDDFSERFFKEGRIIAQLQHPHIVTIYDFNSYGEDLYFSMEYLPGGTLSQRIERGLSAEQSVEIVRGIAAALSYAHSREIIHRDVKPQNILFRQDDTPVLTDFGIARAMAADADTTRLTRFGAIIGSPRYMSPEQIRSQPLDARSDLYSLGIVFYEMLTQRSPYEADDVMSLAWKHCNEPVPALPASLSELQPILDKLIAKKPDERFENARQLIDALDRVKRRLPSEAGSDDATRIVPPEQFAYKPAAADVSGPRKSWVIAGLFILFTAAGVGMYFLVDREPELQEPEITRGLPPRQEGASTTATNYERLAIEHFQRGELDRSLELTRLGLATAPDDARLTALYGRLQRYSYAGELHERASRSARAGLLDQSASLIEDGLHQVPNHPALLSLQTEVQARIRERDKQKADQLVTQAKAFSERGELERSLAMIEQGLQLVPDHTGLLALRVALEKAQEQRKKAAQLLVEAQELHRKKALPASLALVEEALQLDPENRQLIDLRVAVQNEQTLQRKEQAASFLLKARERFERGELEESLNLVEEGLKQVPNDAQLLSLRERLEAKKRQEEKVSDLKRKAADLHQQGDLDASRRVTEEALRLAPNRRDLLDLRDELQSEAAERDRIIGLLEGCQADFPLESISDEQGEAAADCYEQILAVSAGNADALERLAQIADRFSDWAGSALNDGDLDKAESLLHSLRGINPSHRQLSSLGEELSRRKEQRSAELKRQKEEAAARQAAEESGQESQVPERTKAEVTAPASTPSPPSPPDQTPEAIEEELALTRAERREIQRWLNALGYEAGHADGVFSFRTRLAIAEYQTRFGESASGYVTTDLLTRLRRQYEAAAPKPNPIEPEMVVVAGGCYQMGSPQGEKDRENDERQHQACVKGFHIAKHELTVKEFGRFVEATGYQTDAERNEGGEAGCWSLDPGAQDNGWNYHAWASWRKPIMQQSTVDDHPVSCVSWNDAQAYISWLNEATNQHYRLPTETEWEYAARAGTTTSRFWGAGVDQQACLNANVADKGNNWQDGFPCSDGYEWIAPIGRFQANSWGLHDVLGNVWEWTCSAYDEGYGGRENECVPATSDAPRVLRGGSWYSGPKPVRSAYRDRAFAEYRYSFLGFRLLRD